MNVTSFRSGGGGSWRPGTFRLDTMASAKMSICDKLRHNELTVKDPGLFWKSFRGFQWFCGWFCGFFKVGLLVRHDVEVFEVVVLFQRTWRGC